MHIITTYHGRDWYDFANDDPRVFDKSSFVDQYSAELFYQKNIENNTKYLKAEQIPWFAVTMLSINMETGVSSVISHMARGVQRVRLEFNKKAKQPKNEGINPKDIWVNVIEDEVEEDEEHN